VVHDARVFERFFKHFKRRLLIITNLSNFVRAIVFLTTRLRLSCPRLEDNANVFETQEAGAKEKLKEFIENCACPIRHPLKFIYLDI
jgi:hypothetical protein